MAHPYASKQEKHPGRRRAQEFAKGFKKGGAVHADAAQDRKLIKDMASKGEIKVEGKASGGRLDKFARGGGVKKPTTKINIIVAPQKADDKPEAPPMPPMGAMPPPPPPKPPMAPVVPGAGLPPAGGPPLMRKSGGRTPMKGGAETGVGRLDKVKAQKKAK